MWLVILITAGAACGQDKTTPKSTPPNGNTDQLLQVLRTSFQKRNPKLTKVGILDLRAPDFLGPRLVLGWAIVDDLAFRGDFNDEMFGLFVVNENLTTVEHVVDMFATKRWFDYEVRLSRFSADSVEVVGKGATYGDEPMSHKYKWR